MNKTGKMAKLKHRKRTNRAKANRAIGREESLAQKESSKRKRNSNASSKVD